jgi:hypothetical protein
MLTLVSTSPDADTAAPAPKLKFLSKEMHNALKLKIEQLRQESERVLGTMERTMFRILTQGDQVSLDGLTLGTDWVRLASEIQALQETLQAHYDSE